MSVADEGDVHDEQEDLNEGPVAKRAIRKWTAEEVIISLIPTHILYQSIIFRML